MSSIHSDSENGESTQFLVKIFYKTGSYPRPEDIHSSHPPPCATFYTDQSATLADLAALFSAHATPSPLPSPAGGTRLSFQLVFPDIRSPQLNRYMTKDLGSVVIGELGPGDAADDHALAKLRNEVERDSRKTLAQAKFVVGDSISCAVVPPSEDGTVALHVPVRRDSKPMAREIGRAGRDYRGGGGGGGGGGRGFHNPPPSFPMGEWRRGEPLPDAPRSRGGGRWRS